MALGKGLGSLIPAKYTPPTTVEKETQSSSHPTEINVSDLQVNPYQPRQHFSHHKLEELIQSIKQHGVIQPLLVTKTETGYQLIAGERRLRASRIAGLKTVPVVIRKVDDLEKLELALIENIQRSDLDPIEKAKGYQRLVDEFSLNHEEAAKKVGISRSTFSNILRLLDLPDNIQKALTERTISEGHAKVLLGVNSTTEQQGLFQQCIEQHLSVRALEQIVKGDQNVVYTSRTSSTKKTNTPLHIKDFEQSLSRALATKVKIQPKGEGGAVTVLYYSPEELAEIVNKIASKITKRRV